MWSFPRLSHKSCSYICLFQYSIVTANTSAIDFSDCDDIPAAFSLLTAEISKILKGADFFTLRRAIVQQRRVPRGVQFSDDLYQNIKMAQDLDSLLDLLADSKHWSWVDLRLLEALIMSSGINAAKILVANYKKAVFSKKLSEVLDKMFMPQQKKDKEAYATRVGMKILKEPNEITVADLSEFAPFLETVIMDINNGTCVLEHVTTGCLEIYWLIPTHCSFHAYKSALNNRHKFCELFLQYLHIEPYPPIYDPFTVQPTVLSTLLHSSKPIACKYIAIYCKAKLFDGGKFWQIFHQKALASKTLVNSCLFTLFYNAYHWFGG